MFDHIPLVLAQANEDPPPREPTDNATPADGQNDAAADGQTATPQTQTQKQDSPFNPFMIMMLLMIGVFFFIMMSGQRREKKKRATILASLKKGAKVQTIGGIRGTIVEVRDSEVVVKVDENSNTRIRFSRESVQGVIEDKSEKEE
jgi:preprotein translocase subunit YajC